MRQGHDGRFLPVGVAGVSYATVDDRFWAKADRSGGPDACWPWTASLQNKGYGQFNYGGTMAKAHRVAYILTHGTIPDGMTLDHLCRVRRCVNPAHLEPVSFKTNVLRGIAPVATNAAKTHCIHGHPFDTANTYIRRDTGSRQCRTCIRDWQRRNARRPDLREHRRPYEREYRRRWRANHRSADSSS